MMKKEKNGVKATLLSLVMAAVLMLPMSLLAQKSDSFFRSNNNDDVYNDRDASTLINGGGFTNNPMNQQDPNSPAPIGSGLLIMVAAGAGYAVIRRKKTVRKSAALLMAGVLMLGFTQCRKKDVATVVDNTANLVPMTLTTDGAKTSFDDGVISWVSGDKLNVVAGGKCIGTLTYESTDFTGYVDLGDFYNLDETTFYFYYVGNQTITANATSFTMSMSGQTGAKADLGNFHVSKGSQNVVINKTEMNVSARMRSYTSVAYFNVSGFNRYSETGENLYMYGDNIYEQLTINFSDNSITPEHDGYYISAGTSDDKEDAYYMFIPTSADGQTEVNHFVNFVNKRTSATTTFKYGIVSNGWYCNGGFDEPIAVTGASYDAGTLRGEFTINNSKGTVHFSQGNLQYTRESTSVNWSTGVWSFKTNQYDKDAADKNVGTDYANKSVINYFGWGTSGYDNGNTYYYPYNTSVGTDTQGYGYGPTDGSSYTISLTGTTDWGYNKIINGGDENNLWRTPSSDEWVYMLKTRKVIVNSISKDSYGEGTIMGVSGLLILPDNWDGSLHEDFIYGKSAWSNIINENTSPTWGELEAAGVVFLPIAGNRTGTNEQNMTVAGYYWSSTPYSNKVAYGIYIASNYAMDLTSKYSYNRNLAYLVRLVRE